jgi:uncharacterized damage-inducible protein DinB
MTTGQAATGGSIRRFYDGWQVYNQQLIDVVRAMTDEQLRVKRTAPDAWPVWATIGHTAGARLYWLCGILGEPGAERTPFGYPLPEEGWEDDLDTPRGSDELVLALTTTWDVIDGCLERWTPEMLDEPFTRHIGGRTQIHKRQSVLMRMITHEAYHCGELSLTLATHGLPQIDLWPPRYTS